MRSVFIVLAIVAFAMSCAGPEGPTGPAGEQGEPGPGSRVVYQSTTPIPTNSAFVVNVPEIELDDMPAVSVYICYLCIAGYSAWVELPFYYKGDDNWGMAYFLEEGRVTFSNCEGYYYKIVVIT